LTVSRGGRPVLRDLDFALDGGQLVALVGRNGVGKTTLLRSLAGLQPYGGTISALSAAGPQPPEFALVFQNPDLQLFNASVHAEIVYRLADPDAGLLAYLLAALDLERYAATPPLLLSEGEKRRVALAMLLLRQPRHGLLLDEPSLGQDEVHKATLLRLLRAYAAAGFMVIYATHDLELAAQADTLLLLGPDGLAAQGPPGEVFAQGRVWDDLGFLRPAWMGLPCSA
jgi:energy-coupling factor transport system ATP-binding protein